MILFRKVFSTSLLALFAVVIGCTPAQAAPISSENLHDFGVASGPDGQSPYSNVAFDAANNMYGTTSAGGNATSNGYGIVWEITNAGAYKVLHVFGKTITLANGKSGTDGYNPYRGVTLDSSGNLYGTAVNGGANSGGIVWELTTSGTYKDLHDFGGPSIVNASGKTGPDGYNPYCGITIDTAGNLYGTTSLGGPYAGSGDFGGVLWKISSSGVYKDLHDFGGTATDAAGQTAPDGFDPIVVKVALDSTGAMYGTTQYAGANKAGMVWKLTTTGVYEDLHDFGGQIVNADLKPGLDGGSPQAGATIDDEDNVYGTTLYGGSSGAGMVWELPSGGNYTDLHDFGGTVYNSDEKLGNDGYNPSSGITLDTAGNLYGTTTGGGANSSSTNQGGSAWEISRYGEYYDLHDFGGTVPNASGSNEPDGVNVQAGVAFDAYGNLCGTTFAGGANKLGMVWRLFTEPFPSLVVLKPNPVIGGSKTALRVDLTRPAPVGGVTVLVTSSRNAVGVPASIKFNAGQDTETVDVSTPSVTADLAVTITAKLNGGTATASLEVEPPVLASVALPTAPVLGGATTYGTVTLATAAPTGGTVVNLSSSSSSAKVAATVTVGAGETNGRFAIATSAVGPNVVVTITAKLGSLSKSANMTLAGPTPASVTVSPTSVIGGTSVTGTVTLNYAAPAGGLVVSLSTSKSSAQPPATVTVPAGSKTATFSITTAPVGDVQTPVITAKFNSITASGTLTVEPPELSGLTLSTTTVQGSSSTSVTGTITVTGPLPASVDTVKLTSSDSSVVSVPATVTVSGSATTVTFTVTHSAVTTTQTITITAVYGSVTKTVQLTITP